MNVLQLIKASSSIHNVYTVVVYSDLRSYNALPSTVSRKKAPDGAFRMSEILASIAVGKFL